MEIFVFEYESVCVFWFHKYKTVLSFKWEKQQHLVFSQNHVCTIQVSCEGYIVENINIMFIAKGDTTCCGKLKAEIDTHT